MTGDWADRTKKLIGQDRFLKLSKKSVVVLGLGGVGGSCAEALCRVGVGRLILVDPDKFDITNLNRQILATEKSVGINKCEVAKRRFELINPHINIEIHGEFCLPKNSEFIFATKADYIADCIDTVTTKIFLAIESNTRGMRLISCLGMGNRWHPEAIRFGKIEETSGSGCALARVMRQKLKATNTSLDVVYSTERPEQPINPPGSVSFVPPVAGYFMASKIVERLLERR